MLPGAGKVTPGFQDQPLDVLGARQLMKLVKPHGVIDGSQRAVEFTHLIQRHAEHQIGFDVDVLLVGGDQGPSRGPGGFPIL